MLLLLSAPSISVWGQEEPVREIEAANEVVDEAPSVAVDSARLDELDRRLSEQEEQLSRQQSEIKKLTDENTRLSTALDETTTSEEADAEALVAQLEAPVDAQPEKLQLYGFMDMAFKKIYVPEDSRFNGLVSDASTFALGNVNLYIDARPVPEIRALTEVRFTLYPLGSAGDDLAPTDTRVYDVTSATGRNQVAWSGIVLERAHIEWTRYEKFRVLAGYFLTPYGIWNVDHGSPTLISSVLPGFWAGEYFPTRQLGVQASGDFFVDRWQLGYRAYVSNGRNIGQLDVDKNKQLGARIFGTLASDFQLTVGASGFWAKNQEFVQSIASVDPFRVSSNTSVSYEEFGVGADVSLNAGDFRLRTEIVLNTQYYDDGLRPATSPVTFQRDRTRWDTYGIASYRLPWFELEPFLYFEYDQRPNFEDDASAIYSAGVIEHLYPGVQLKFQGYYVGFLNSDEFPNASVSNFAGWDARFVTAF